ncbi:hypothetical protein MTR_7g117440 [Medicago truncatula]|uniref:Uncharacterized protein n=1 Tax=Medicago truncatula TaxID=3880 RepID=A0A072U663_MEDTR|nr:hypothetical protein MTR_7g117440 [Medicago truncatula]
MPAAASNILDQKARLSLMTSRLMKWSGESNHPRITEIGIGEGFWWWCNLSNVGLDE